MGKKNSFYSYQYHQWNLFSQCKTTKFILLKAIKLPWRPQIVGAGCIEGVGTTPPPPLRRNDCNYVAGSVPFSYQSSGYNSTSGELFFNSAAQVYILFFYRAATFTSSGETIASYQEVWAPFSYQGSSFTNTSGVLSEVRSRVYGSVPFSY
jgi:hypothetical protein